jgi:hypothetical protein
LVVIKQKSLRKAFPQAFSLSASALLHTEYQLITNPHPFELRSIHNYSRINQDKQRQQLVKWVRLGSSNGAAGSGLCAEATNEHANAKVANAVDYGIGLFQSAGTGELLLPALRALASAPALPVFCYSSWHRLAQSFALLSSGQA